MTSPAKYIENLELIWSKLDKLEAQIKHALSKLDQHWAKLDKIAMQVDEIYNDDPSPIQQDNRPDEELTMEERIKRYGQKVPYHIIDDPVEVMKFKDWIYDAKRIGHNLSDVERDLLDIADKNFEDIRLSSKHISVLKTINQKLYRKPWPFKSKQGYMYKLEGYQPEWEFFT